MRNLRGQVALYSPAARGKLSSPQRGGHTINLSVHPSTETGQLHKRVESATALIWKLLLVAEKPSLPTYVRHGARKELE